MYYSKWISENGSDGRWNVIQVINGQARYFVLKTPKLVENPNTGPFIGHGWIEKDLQGLWWTDGEDYILLDDWEKHEGILIPFN